MEGIYFLVASVLAFTVGIDCVPSLELGEEADDTFISAINYTLRVRNPQGKKGYKLFNTPTSWNEALILCKQGGMELATIRNAEDNQMYTNLVTAASGISTMYIWIGGTVLWKPSLGWCWVADGQPMTLYTNWDSGEPNNGDGNERCLSTVFSKPDQPWNDDNCYHESPFVCEYFE